MGKVTQKDIDALPESEKKKVDNAKEKVMKTMPKKVKETKEIPKKVKEDAVEICINKLSKDLDKLGNWIGNIDADLKSLEDLVDRIAKRMGM